MFRWSWQGLVHQVVAKPCQDQRTNQILKENCTKPCQDQRTSKKINEKSNVSLALAGFGTANRHQTLPGPANQQKFE